MASINPPTGRHANRNAAVWVRGDFVDEYAVSDLRPPEAKLLDLHRRELSGRVLELGCGAGRVTGHLLEHAQSVHGLDLAPAMIAFCRSRYPQGTFTECDLRDLSRFESGAFEAIVAPFCVLDVFEDETRRLVLDEVLRLLVPGGLLIFSSHNLHYAPNIRRPTHIRSRSPLRIGLNLLRLPVRVRNRRRLLPLERVGADYSILVDEAHDFSLLHYYISRDSQARQLGEQGFELLECLDLDAEPVAPGERRSGCPELHYAARGAPKG
jgi:SAM-dependent methyltransferase